MTKEVISEDLRKDFLRYLKPKRKLDLLTNYLYFISKKYDIHPIVSPKHKMIFRSLEEAMEILEKEGKIWRETHVRIGQERAHVNEETKKIYICPFSGKVFADNTHPNPQDAIYDWVSHCPENTERKDGLVVKRFFVSEDPEMIKNYIEKTVEPITKVVFSSAITGALYNSKDVIIDEFKKDFVKSISLEEIQNQNRYELEAQFLQFIQTELAEEKVTKFIEALSEYEEFLPYVQKWLED
ncbi:MAG: hypothetical protein S4CHLAM7_05880 [Chlamydiae bacterium]|nr:hypothetical protein [Chlamydiota bacterium]